MLKLDQSNHKEVTYAFPVSTFFNRCQHNFLENCNHEKLVREKSKNLEYSYWGRILKSLENHKWTNPITRIIFAENYNIISQLKQLHENFL